MKLIAAEVIWETPPDYMLGTTFAKPEGSTWYPDGLVFVKTRTGTPKWNIARHRRWLGSRSYMRLT